MGTKSTTNDLERRDADACTALEASERDLAVTPATDVDGWVAARNRRDAAQAEVERASAELETARAAAAQAEADEAARVEAKQQAAAHAVLVERAALRPTYERLAGLAKRQLDLEADLAATKAAIVRAAASQREAAGAVGQPAIASGYEVAVIEVARAIRAGVTEPEALLAKAWGVMRAGGSERALGHRDICTDYPAAARLEMLFAGTYDATIGARLRALDDGLRAEEKRREKVRAELGEVANRLAGFGGGYDREEGERLKKRKEELERQLYNPQPIHPSAAARRVAPGIGLHADRP